MSGRIGLVFLFAFLSGCIFGGEGPAVRSDSGSGTEDTGNNGQQDVASGSNNGNNGRDGGLSDSGADLALPDASTPDATTSDVGPDASPDVPPDLPPTCGNGMLDDGELCDPMIANPAMGGCPQTLADCMEDSCNPWMIQGTPDDCTAECVQLGAVTMCIDSDGCCPSTCTELTDNDCMPVCGNGAHESGEICDGNCPLSCDDGDVCTRDSLNGTSATCDAECSNTVITACVNGDGCCPPACDQTSDSDCSATCGDGVVDVGETCDGNCPTACTDDGDACTTENFSGSPVNCTAACLRTTITTCSPISDMCCPSACNATNDPDCSATCGNGTIEMGETCDGNCPASCDDGVACTADSQSGSALNCNLVCTNSPITSCVNGDGCCATGCNANNDDDCAPTCGNGVVEMGETCDLNCPASCNDGDACTMDAQTGSPGLCNVACSNTAITSCLDGDGCCPGSCTSVTDDDCGAFCGNGIPEPGETCDPCPADCDDADACTSDSSTGDPNMCSLVCSNAPISSCIDFDGCCPASCDQTTDLDCMPVCGNGVVESGEDCDGGPGGTTCVDLGYSGGTLMCSGCLFDDSGCTNVAPSASHLMFKSSTTMQGKQVLSVANADTLCNVAGNSSLGGLGYSWVALISDSNLNIHAQDRLVWGNDVYNMAGEQLRSSTAWPWTTLLNPVRVDEDGNDVGTTKAWTGTSTSGLASGEDCQDGSGIPWRGENGTGGNSGAAGRAQSTASTNGWLDGGGIDPCNSSSFGLYCVSALPQPDIYAFVTSRTYTGSGFNGLSGADQECQRLGASGSKTSSLKRDWVAMMSDLSQGIDVIDRVSWDSADYGTRAVYNVQGDLVESDSGTWPWALEAAIQYDENGTAVPTTDYVWTGSISAGSAHSSHCSGWTSANAAANGMAGYANSTSSLWLGDNLVSCDTALRLICVSR